MAKYPYTTVPGKLRPLLDKMRTASIPGQANAQWIESIGFAARDDRSMLNVLRCIGFIDESGTPTEAWREYRGAEHATVLASAIRKGYAGLFDVYEDAYRRSADDIRNVVKTSTSAGDRTISRTVSTFQRLCSRADFSKASEVSFEDDEAAVSTAIEEVAVAGVSSDRVMPSLHIDIHVHINPDATLEQIDKIFESMGKHLCKDKC